MITMSAMLNSSGIHTIVHGISPLKLDTMRKFGSNLYGSMLSALTPCPNHNNLSPLQCGSSSGNSYGSGMTVACLPSFRDIIFRISSVGQVISVAHLPISK